MTTSAYEIKVVNGGDVKHEFTAGDFFNSVAFRKAEDASAEFKAPAPREVEVFAGMFGTITVIGAP